MEQFVYGLLTGVALGMWLAILLYIVAGKRRQGLSLRRRKEPDAQLPARDRDGRPADDFDYYYAQHGESDAGDAGATVPPRVPDPPAEPASAPVSSPDREQAQANDEAEDGNGDGDRETGGEGDGYQRLVAKLDGDVAAAERLIDYEQQRTPAAPRAVLIQNALDRLQHDPR